MRPRGARPSPRYRLAAAAPHRIIGDTPPNFLWKPSLLDMWLNATYGDCVSAEECFAKACNNPEIFITDATLEAWATKNGVLNGADLITVLDTMETAGFQQEGHTYDDGAPTAVDWTNATILQNAIAQGPVKIGIAAEQIEAVVGSTNGWLATGFAQDSNEDHCVSLCGYGEIQWLMNQFAMGLPATIVPTLPGYAMFTWGTIGVIDVPSLLAICGEAWLRTPTTIIR